MADRLTWVFEIQDRMSGPARKIDQAVGQVDRRMRSVDRASRAAESGTARAASGFSRLTMKALQTIVALGRIATAIQAIITVGRMLGVRTGSWRVALNGLSSGAKKAGAALRRFASGAIARLRRVPPHVWAIGAALGATAIAARTMGRALSSAVGFVRNAASAATMAAGFIAFGAAVKGATEAIDAMVSRERSLRALTILGGSAAEGMRMRARFSDLSDFLGIDPREVQRGMQELLTKGFSETESMRIFQGVSDVAALSPSADVGRIILAMSQIKQAGVLQGDELNQLAESGLPLVHVYERIGEAMGVAASEVRGLRGTVPAAVAIQAILEGIQDTTGQELGGVSRAASLGLGGQLERLKQAPTRIFDALADQSSAAGQRIAALVAKLNEFLNPNSATGQRIIESMVSALEMAVSAIEMISAGIASIDPGTLRSMWLGLKIIGGSLAAVVVGVGVMGAAVVHWLGGLVEPFTDIEGKFRRFGELLTDLAAWFQGIGGQSIDGFIFGFMGGVSRALVMVQTFGAQAAGALRSALGIHSPSRVFMEAGQMSGEGFEIGLANSMPGQSYDYGGLAPAPDAARASGGGVTNNITIEVRVAPGENAGQLADDIAQAIRREVTALFEGVAAEQGMA